MSKTIKHTSLRGVNYAVKFFSKYEGFWFHWWTPIWHKGRGVYISIGCGYFALYRGY